MSRPYQSRAAGDSVAASTYASDFMQNPIPKTQIPAEGMPANVVCQAIKDLRSLDARPNLNLASFVTTFMEDEARQLMADSIDVNFVDSDEYPSSQDISNRCLNMLASLYHSPAVDENGVGDAVGAPTVGSSEAIMLGALALKKSWMARRKAAGLDISSPNLVMGSETHVCWEKFCRYWDVEPRYVLAEEGRYAATPELLAAMCDENTIGVVAVLGSTYTGEYEDVPGIDAAVEELNNKNGWGIKIHVDGASGAFVAPFLTPDFEFDFRLKNVASINVSGHKYGLVYPGLGWIIWRDTDHLPESMVFWANYLGTTERSITLNFSRGASQIIGQFYQFLRLGFDGYARIMTNLRNIANRLRDDLIATGHFEILSKDIGVPVVTFKLKTKELKLGNDIKLRNFDEFNLADRLRIAGWVVPAYTMPKGAEHVKCMRFTIREDFSATMAEALIEALKVAVAWLDEHHIVSEAEVDAVKKLAATLDNTAMNSIGCGGEHYGYKA